MGEWGGGWAGVKGTATLGFGKLIRVQESSERGERMDLHKAHLHNVPHKLCSQKAAGLAQRGRWLHVYMLEAAAARRGKGETQDGTPPLASTLSCSVFTRPTLQ